VIRDEATIDRIDALVTIEDFRPRHLRVVEARDLDLSRESQRR
jgi:hypothetical protein